MPRNKFDLTDKKFGKLTVLSEDGRKNSKIFYKCECECGNIISVRGASLLTKRTKSCGCLKKEKHHIEYPPHYKKLYNTYANMKVRCNDQDYKEYHLYGGRGIKIDKCWSGYGAFYEWAMASGYEEGLTIDRIDVNGNYSPSNCRWATSKEQTRNKRNNINLTYKGETMCLQDMAIKYNINRDTLITRIKKGMSIEEAIETPVANKNRRLNEAYIAPLDTQEFTLEENM